MSMETFIISSSLLANSIIIGNHTYKYTEIEQPKKSVGVYSTNIAKEKKIKLDNGTVIAIKQSVLIKVKNDSCIEDLKSKYKNAAFVKIGPLWEVKVDDPNQALVTAKQIRKESCVVYSEVNIAKTIKGY